MNKITIKSLSEKKKVQLLLALLLVFFVCIMLFSEASFDAGDGIQHYVMARFSWLHPYLFLDSWGKPFFTLISSPFAQLGIKGVIFFNILCGIGTSYLAYLIAKKSEIENTWLIIPIVLFAPGFFPTLNSGLTEPFFGFLLLGCTYGFVCKKYALATLLISFLPFIRTEGFFLMPLFACVLLLRKQYFHIVFLGLGTIVYSIIGWLFLDDFLWIIHQNPYNGSNREIYGHGEWWHFISNYNYLFGITLSIFLTAGLLAIIKLIYQNNQKQIKIKNSYLPEELILLIGSFLVYFIAHSIMWWKGWANSLGMLRVIAAVLPCTSLLCLRGLNLLFINQLRKIKIIKYAILFVSFAGIVITPLKKDYFPFTLTPEQKVTSEAAKWFKESKNYHNKVYFLDPFFGCLLDIDSYDTLRSAQLWGLYPSIEKHGIEIIPDSSIVIWDSHFGPNECHIPLSKLIQDKNFKLIKSFVPEQRFTTLGGHAFELHVFMKVSKVQAMGTLKSVKYNFETPLSSLPAGEMDSTISFSGNKCLKIINSNEFSASFNMPIGEIPPNTLLCKMQARIYNPNPDSLKIISVISFNDQNNNNLMYDGKDLVVKQSATNKDWYLLESTCNLIPSSYAAKSNKFGFYLWNLNHKTFYIDDIELHFIGKK